MTVDHLDQEQKLQRRALRKANELFLQRLQAEAQYDPVDDFARSIDDAYARIRERMANGGKGWTPP
jgi:hypothetical protein